MDDRSLGSDATFFDTAGRRLSAGVARQPVGGPADIRRALGIPAEGMAHSVIPAELQGAFGLTAESERAARAPGEGETGLACFEMHIGSYVIPIEVTVDLTTNSPYSVLSGALLFESIEVSRWQVTEGSFGITGTLSSPSVLLTDSLYLVAELLPPSNEGTEPEAELADIATPTVTILGWYRPPLSYPGIYVTGEGYYYHDTLFRGWQACS